MLRQVLLSLTLRLERENLPLDQFLRKMRDALLSFVLINAVMAVVGW